MQPVPMAYNPLPSRGKRTVKARHTPKHGRSTPPATSEQVTERNIEAILRSEKQAKARETLGDVIAHGITRFCGSMTFVWVHLVWFGVWSVLNLTLPPGWRWDPLPFPFLTLIVSLEAIFLSTFILITENREGAIAARRAQLDLQINLLAEQENTKMLLLLERIASRLGVEPGSDAEMRALEENTHPEKVLEQIDRLEGKPPDGKKKDRAAE